MMVILMITALGTAALAKGPKECDLTNATEGHQCFGELGKPLMFHLSTDPTRKTSLKKDENIILNFDSNGLLNVNERYKNNFRYLKNGTFIVDKITKKNSGVYQLKEHSSTTGLLMKKINIHLKIQAPVSEPSVSQTCSSAELLTVSCSAEGDDVNITLFLDNLLIQTKPQTTDNESTSHVTINLRGQLAGNLKCEVQNDISSEQKTIHLTSCKGSTFLTVPVMAVVIVLLLLLIVFLCVKLFKKKTNPLTVKEDDAPDEVVYSTVTVTRAK